MGSCICASAAEGRAVKLHRRRVGSNTSAISSATATFRLRGFSPHIDYGSDHIHSVVSLRNNSVFPCVRTRHERDTAMSVDMIAAILYIIFDQKNQRVLAVYLAIGDLLDKFNFL